MNDFSILRCFRWRINLVLLAVIVVISILGTNTVWSEQAIGTKTKRVLIISSYSSDFPAYALFADGIRQRLAEDPNTAFQIFHESLDLLRFSNNDSFIENLETVLWQKYRNSRPDIIIVHGEPATHFVKQYGTKIFGDTPTILVAYAYFQEMNRYRELPTNYTVIAPLLENTDKALQLILDLKPDTNKIYIVLGASAMEKNTLQNITQQFSLIPECTELIYLDDLAYQDLIEYIQEIRGNAAILFLTFQQDVNGVGYVPTDVIKEISKVAQVPVFGLVQPYIGSGCIGGYMINTKSLSLQAADRAVDILQGKTAKDYPVEIINTGSYWFDWREIHRWDIDEASLPQGSLVMYRPTNFMYVYKWYIVGGVLLFAIQTIILVLLVKNLRKRKIAEQELIRLDRLNIVGEMAASIGHEVRNPLTTVRGYLQIFQRKEKFIEHREQLATMIEELDRANTIITEFLSLAKNKKIDLQPGNLNATIQALLPLLKAEALHFGNEIHEEIGHIPMFNFDDKEIRQLILNLSRNAFEAMEAGGILTIKTCFENGKIVLAVKDTGSGIPKEILNKLGTPFVTTKASGTGLGLPVCYRIADRHGAKIDISTGLEGTTFTLRFPPVNPI